MVLHFFFDYTATTEIYTLSLHDALPILGEGELVAGIRVVLVLLLPAAGLAEPIVRERLPGASDVRVHSVEDDASGEILVERSEEHTSELQSRQYLACRLLLETNTIYKNK